MSDKTMRPVLAMILNALDRDAEGGLAARGEMAAELRAALAQQPAPVAEHHPLDHVEWWANAYEKEGGHAVIVGMLRAYRDMLAASPAAPAPEAQELVAWIVVDEPFHGTHGIEAGEWDVEFDHKAINEMACSNSPGRIALYTTPPAAEQPDTVKVLRELAERLVSRDNYTRQTARRELRNILLSNEVEP